MQAHTYIATCMNTHRHIHKHTCIQINTIHTQFIFMKRTVFKIATIALETHFRSLNMMLKKRHKIEQIMPIVAIK